MQDLVQQQFEANEIEKAQGTCEEILKKFPGDALTLYNLACCQVRLNKNAEGLATLGKAVENGWNEPEHMEVDEDLAAIRGEKKFAELVAATKLNERADGAKYEKGEEIAGVKTVEGFPEEGLRYRIRIPKDATAAKPCKLVIWLHPSGSSMNAQIEKLSPEFAAKGYALMVFTHKQFLAWTDDEETELLTVTLPALKEYKEIDSSRPVLMGYSAGGQFALSLWEDNPEAWSGLIVDGAYPVKIVERDVVGMELPEKTGPLKRTAMRVVVGTDDPGLKRWEMVENKWIAAGVPLTVKTVEGKGHAWLMEGDVLKGTLEWLEEVKEGKLPADALVKRELEI
jgi:predicted esterase